MILLTGATGFIGSHTARALRESNLPVRALVRPGADTAALKKLDVEIVAGSLEDPPALERATQGVEQVIHLVGIIREQPPAVTFERVHTDGTRNLLAAAQKAGVGKFVYISAIGARPTAPARYHQTKWATEELVRASGLAWIVLRPSVVFGPGDEFINLLANDLVRTPPVIPVIGPGTNRLQPLWVKDLARFIVRCVTSDTLDNRTLELGGPEQLSLRRILEILAAYLRVNKPFVSIPLAFVRPAVAIGSAIAPQLLPITSDQLVMLQEDNITEQNPFAEGPPAALTSLSEGIREYLQI
ncbi:SDR family oxidoreductase [Gloeobacter kilaueensis]|uniref:NAD-dependent epimerase/dehydratase n=1 Tax=Gloeobacter kilaueensis (strain ATCC BAA-2537 / CCAP 1431/1 / ULC 316 / JS1) TaxID=1183438 RepID=U5QEF9_GLOK1|nr:complex I NDUFA9 subunit family protein [Gloeobacter kilaueensis]AGY57268.1 NAD-dependent epimerase/dehydratase [Gloeobacter kilaueensis JS1]